MDNKFYKRVLGIAAFFGITGVIAGAFGAHFLKSRIEPGDITTLQTAVLYLFIHTLALFGIALLSRSELPTRLLKTSGAFFIVGIVLFSGSLFVIATQDLTGISASPIGFVTPLGGLCFITGWLLLFGYSMTRQR